MRNVHLMIIDPQLDFCEGGALPVTGANDDIGRTSLMIERLTKARKLHDITVTMDSHRKFDISHPMFWVDAHGHRPGPYTLITAADMESGKWSTRIPSHRGRALDYLRKLEATKRYPHLIWPEHCLIGDHGHNVHPTLSAAIHQWEDALCAVPNVVTKGSNFWTEHFSAVRAEVPDPEDPSTQINRELVDALESADIVPWAGQALSHCLANTFRDTIANFTDPAHISKMVLLTDATSNVDGFEKLGDDFVREMQALGMKTSTCADFLA